MSSALDSHFESLREALAEENPNALLADGFETCLVGLGRRCGQPTLAVYDYQAGVQLLILRDGMTHEEAEEYLEFNVVGAWMGEHTPLWLCRPSVCE